MSRAVNWLTLTEMKYPPGLVMPPHSHPRASFCLILRGTYAESYSKKTLSCRPQTVTFRPAEEQHWNNFEDTESHCFYIDIESQSLESLQEYGPVLNAPTDFHGGPVLWTANRLYNEFRETDAASALAIEGLGLEIMAAAFRTSAAAPVRRIPRWLKQARELLQEEFSENISLAHLAEIVGVHPVYLASEFRRQYGSSVGEYIRRLRIDYACRELRESDAPLVHIALSAGFSCQSHFSRTFKRMTGITPALYRATLPK